MAISESVARAKKIVEEYSGPKVRIMEVCGTHTHEIFRLGIRSILPDNIELISGPGCPVCVTPIGYIDEALTLALDKEAVICTFGDLVRVPGTDMSMADARAQGADIRIVYSPLDALDIAEREPDREIVFLSVGFETTTPGSCIAVRNAGQRGTNNFSILTSEQDDVQCISRAQRERGRIYISRTCKHDDGYAVLPRSGERRNFRGSDRVHGIGNHYCARGDNYKTGRREALCRKLLHACRNGGRQQSVTQARIGNYDAV